MSALNSPDESADREADGAPVDIVGTDGPWVLLLPGGAEPVRGFFPGLVEGLVSDPGARVVCYDRPGTGANRLPGGLPDAARALHTLLLRHRIGPVVVIGQSLGGAVAALLARDYPGDVAGLVLLDPTPVNDVAFARQTEWGVRIAAALQRNPITRGAVTAATRAIGKKVVRDHDLSGPARDALDRVLAADPRRVHAAAAGLTDIARSFDETALPSVPAAVVTADRRDGHRCRRAHARLASALAAPLIQWPGALHPVHLTHPDEVLAVCRDVIGASCRERR